LVFSAFIFSLFEAAMSVAKYRRRQEEKRSQVQASQRSKASPRRKAPLRNMMEEKRTVCKMQRKRSGIVETERGMEKQFYKQRLRQVGIT